jgi:cytoskeletal protein CcmA (bactofilin family)
LRHTGRRRPCRWNRFEPGDQIAQTGTLNGTATIDNAEIRGEFKGELTVRKRLMICATGKVTGKIAYGKLVIEEGGELIGEIQAMHGRFLS